MIARQHQKIIHTIIVGLFIHMPKGPKIEEKQKLCQSWGASLKGIGKYTALPLTTIKFTQRDPIL